MQYSPWSGLLSSEGLPGSDVLYVGGDHRLDWQQAGKDTLVSTAQTQRDQKSEKHPVCAGHYTGQQLKAIHTSAVKTRSHHTVSHSLQLKPVQLTNSRMRGSELTTFPQPIQNSDVCLETEKSVF